MEGRSSSGQTWRNGTRLRAQAEAVRWERAGPQGEQVAMVGGEQEGKEWETVLRGKTELGYMGPQLPGWGLGTEELSCQGGKMTPRAESR